MSPTKPPALRLLGLSKKFGPTQAVDGLSFEVADCEIVALIGPSGCGKTTTLRLIAGLETLDAGLIQIGGVAAGHLPVHERSVGLVFQDYALFPHLNVIDNVAFGVRGSRSAKIARANEVLGIVGITELAGRFPSQLSGGQQQRVALARAIAPAPKILLLDEPFSNLDPELRRRVRHEVLSMIRSAGVAALWVTHDHDEGMIVADRVVVMGNGRVHQTGTPAEVWRRPADAWVAGFLGNGDLLSGVVREGRVRTPLGEVLADGLPEGRSVQVLVRPEDAGLHPEGHEAKVVRRHFTGNDNIYCVQLQAGGLLHIRQPPEVEIPRNTPVRVRLNTDRLQVFSQ